MGRGLRKRVYRAELYRQASGVEPVCLPGAYPQENLAQGWGIAGYTLSPFHSPHRHFRVTADSWAVLPMYPIVVFQISLTVRG